MMADSKQDVVEQAVKADSEKLQNGEKVEIKEAAPVAAVRSWSWLWLLFGVLLGCGLTLVSMRFAPEAWLSVWLQRPAAPIQLVNMIPTTPVEKVAEPSSKPFSKPEGEQVTEASQPMDAALKQTSAIMPMPELERLNANMLALQDHLQSVRGLQDELQNLSGDIQALHATQSQVRAAQLSVEKMQLHSRLNWVLYPSTHLLQMQLAWEEISLLPSLSNAQREQATAMLNLAQKRLDDVNRWQQNIDAVMRSYALPSESKQELLPEIFGSSSSDGLDWLLSKFSLKRAQKHEDVEAAHMRDLLSRIKQGLDVEQWPDATLWKKVRMDVAQHLMQHNATLPESEQLQWMIPEDFMAIQMDVRRIQQSARDWLKES